MTQSKKSRIATLEDLVQAELKSPTKETFGVPFQGETRGYPILNVPIEFPLYNVNSGRTHGAQGRFIQQRGLPADFFEDPEAPEVQRIQHEILVELINEKRLADDLLRKHQQHALIVTYDGTVIDGNRRLAALREQRKESHVRVVRLPPTATPDEIYATELEVQMSRETKAEYQWVDEARHVRYGVSERFRDMAEAERLHAIAQHMGMPDKAISTILERLALVDLYLAWRGDPGKYHVLPADPRGSLKQAFTDLADRVSQQAVQRLPREEQQAYREACFALIHGEGGEYKEIRKVFDRFRDRPEEFLARLRRSLPPELAARLDTAPAEAVIPAADHGLLGELAQAEPRAPAPAREALAVLRDPEVARQAAPTIAAIAEELDAERLESQKLAEPGQRVEHALRDIQAVCLTSETRSLGSIAENLRQLGELVDRLAREIARLREQKE